ncbi:MAG: acylphosphatase [Candidatus Magasanikbacteria bacterium]|nr:acylphosphatase [Candidatus Magasanikbacteria bacterium]
MALGQLTLAVYGDVQGVGFRWFVQEQAVKLGLVGWVRNNPDGTVGVVAQGVEEKLREFLALCRHGPGFARVREAVEEWQEIPKLDFVDFEIKF